MLITSVKQQGNIVIQVGASLLLTAVVLVGAYNYFIGKSDESVSSRDKGEVVAPVSTAAPEARQSWDATMQCNQLSDYPAFERSMQLVRVEHLFIYERGETARFLAASRNGTAVPPELDISFEWWRGSVSDGKVELMGWYTEGNTSVKALNMTGEIEDGVLRLEGKRGPRNCQVVAQLSQAG